MEVHLYGTFSYYIEQGLHINQKYISGVATKNYYNKVL